MRAAHGLEGADTAAEEKKIIKLDAGTVGRILLATVRDSQLLRRIRACQRF